MQTYIYPCTHTSAHSSCTYMLVHTVSTSYKHESLHIWIYKIQQTYIQAKIKFYFLATHIVHIHKFINKKCCLHIHMHTYILTVKKYIDTKVHTNIHILTHVVCARLLACMHTCTQPSVHSVASLILPQITNQSRLTTSMRNTSPAPFTHTSFPYTTSCPYQPFLPSHPPPTAHNHFITPPYPHHPFFQSHPPPFPHTHFHSPITLALFPSPPSLHSHPAPFLSLHLTTYPPHSLPPSPTPIIQHRYPLSHILSSRCLYLSMYILLHSASRLVQW